jgi:hypothetical protein
MGIWMPLLSGGTQAGGAQIAVMVRHTRPWQITLTKMLTALTLALSVSGAHMATGREEAPMSSELFSPLRPRSGLVLRNRIAKAAMEEGMSSDGQLPD